MDMIDYGFQSLELDFNQATCSPWPEWFEEKLEAFPPQSILTKLDIPPRTAPRRGAHYLAFSGGGVDSVDFDCAGILHPLQPVNQIPGWQRITMMKFYRDDDDDASTPSSSPSSDSFAATSAFAPISNPQGLDGRAEMPRATAKDQCWAYEGVVFPGGQMMLGRWWFPMENPTERYEIGPFIFWSVPDLPLLPEP